jgi:hypothetical protein
MTARKAGGPEKVRFETLRPRFAEPLGSTELTNWQSFEGIAISAGSPLSPKPRPSFWSQHLFT